MRGNLRRLYRQTMSPWAVAPEGCTSGVRELALSSTFAVLHGMKLADESFSPPAGFAIYAAGARA